MKPTEVMSTLANPWKKYNEFFDKGCRNIWGLSPVIKFTYLYFGLFIPYFFVSTIFPQGIQQAVESIFTIGTILILGLWALYMPVLAVITFMRGVKKVKHNTNEFRKVIRKKPWKITPRKLYTKPHPLPFLYAIYLKNELIDFFDWCTQFPPFNLINQDGIKYPLTMKLRHNSRHIEGLLADLNAPLKFESYEINMQNTVYKFKFYEKVKNIDKTINKLENALKKSEYYIREEDGLDYLDIY
ncbi:MAG: hypothetical protein UR98_C0039G0002 [Parcubacteria group bacterium GW2011_GWA1_36_12]|nr:MAG: hypothetical protein UR98_C0039G0002 [Parcubacteria group bacterium GW2011_GWA1_36_12]